MNYAENVRNFIGYYNKQVKETEPVILKQQGKFEAFKDPNDKGLTSPEVDMALFQISVNIKGDVARVLGYVVPWIEQVESESAENRRLLLKLLALHPNSTKQEIEDAIDDVGPVFADFRKKKRGT